jgi:hypothetical protein
VAETRVLEIWMTPEGVQIVLDEAKQSGKDLGVAFIDSVLQRVSMRKAGEDVDLLLRECGQGDCLTLCLPVDRLGEVLGLLLAHRSLCLPREALPRPRPARETVASTVSSDEANAAHA